jgi:6-phosphofructokinase 2
MRAVTLTVNPALDTSTDVDHVVVDRKLRCGPPTREPGGGGINVARVLHRLGTAAIACYPAGGPTGEILTGLLAAEGVDRRPIPIAGWTRENFTVREASSNQQYRFILPGPTLSPEEQTRCLEALTAVAPEYVVVSGSLPLGVPDDFYAQVVRRERERGARVVVDSAGMPLRLAAREGAYLLKPNLRELESLVGRELPTEAEQEAAAREVLAHGPNDVVVVSLGAGGALLATRAATIRLRAPTVRVRSRVGAGDSMVAGIVHGLVHGAPIEDAFRLGIAAGAAAVMTAGTHLCRREDVERLSAAMERA